MITSNKLDEYDRKSKLGDPIELTKEDEHLTLGMLALKYPPPKQDDENGGKET